MRASRLRVVARVLSIVAVGTLAVGLSPRTARASNITEFPDNGSEQMGRGGAWIARASDPLAAFFNPAGLAGQDTMVTLQANVSISRRCMTRTFSQNDQTQDPLVDPKNGVYAYPRVCADISPFPNPQLGFTWRVSDRIGIGFLPLLAPSATGNANWPEFVDGKTANLPSPQRYLLIDSNVLLITPTLGAGFEVIDGLRLGASFQWGIAGKIHFSNAAMAVNQDNANPVSNDIRAQIDAKQLFIPGFTLGGLWSASDNLDVAGWYKWSAPIDGKGDITTYANYFTPAVANGNTNKVQVGDSSVPNCGVASRTDNPCGSGNNGEIKVPIPMEAKIGVRYHKPRPGIEVKKHRRDPLSQDVFDVEVNFTWANNSVFDAVNLHFPASADGTGLLPVNGVSGGTVPPTADVPHKFKDVLGVRLGGDYNVIPDKMALRAGAFFETSGQEATYQNIDFAPTQRVGLALGGTYRIRMGAEKKAALEVHLGYGHIFFATQSNNQVDGQGISALAGTQCNAGSGNGSVPQPGGTCTVTGNQQYRSNWPVNLGTITNQVNVINAGVTYRF